MRSLDPVDPGQRQRELALIEAKLLEDGWRERMAQVLGVHPAGVTAQFLWNWSRRYEGLHVLFDKGRPTLNPMYHGPEESVREFLEERAEARPRLGSEAHPREPLASRNMASLPALPAETQIPSEEFHRENSGHGQQEEGQGRQEGLQARLIRFCEQLLGTRR